DPSELTDQYGVFVSPNGQPHTDGNHVRPALTIQDGIDLAKRVGKRVYVCAGTFHEQITIADSISIIGGLDCTNNDWTVGKPGSRTRIEAPSSPAVTATKITSPTRLEGLDIVAPDAHSPSGSSIALLADHAGALTVASSKLTAGNAAKGDDGKDGIQLANAPTVHGGPGWDDVNCTAGAGCNHNPIRIGLWLASPRAPHGENVCVGAAGFVGEAGGYGGSGGLYQIEQPDGIVSRPVYYLHMTQYGSEPGDHTRTSAAGSDGSDGANAPSDIALSAAGFTAVSGSAGKNGAPGSGGRGGDGFGSTTNDPLVGDVWTGWSGAGGGAGGCPGLAGGEGKGGGASIAAVLVESPVSFDAVELLSNRGGAGGLGAFGSAPTTGGAPGYNTQPSLLPMRNGQPGGRGGLAGASGNGANGPSLGIAYVGTKPVVSADTKVTPGDGGAAIPARSRTTLGITKTIPASPAGISKDIVGL
ncbi:MAG: virulence associated protein, partial [Myxococcaceae bacterium]|nr:virulence associated protein [Myxococcaceae bacterium]